MRNERKGGRSEDLSVVATETGRAQSLWRRVVSELMIAGLLVIAATVFAYATEIRLIGAALVVVASLLLFCGLRILTVGPVTAATLSTILIGAVFTISKLKFWLTARRLHPFDFYLYGSWNNLPYLRHLYPTFYIWIYLALGAAIAVPVAIAVMERHRPWHWVHAGLAVLCIGSLAGFQYESRYMEGAGYGPGNRFLHFDQQHVSTFIISTIKMIPSFMRGSYFDYGPAVPLASADVALAKINACPQTSGANAPNVVLILRESAMIPADFPEMGAPLVGPAQFASGDGKTHRLRVETHGAGSAHSILSALTGLSSEAFGDNKILSLDLSISSLHFSLPILLRSCGYRTIAISSGPDGYVASTEFYRRIGFDDVFDLAAVSSKSAGDISDKAFYGFLNDLMTKTSDGRPIFAYMDTTASHAPYNYTIRKEEQVSEASGAINADVAEYVRRLVIGERDLNSYMKRLADQTSPAGRGTVVLDFGDHQPYFTKDLPGHPGYVLEDPDADDRHLITYFRIRSAGFNVTYQNLPQDHGLVDVAFLSDWLLRSIGWQGNGIYRDRWDMLVSCKSRYWQCDQHRPAHRLHQMLRAAGFIDFS